MKRSKKSLANAILVSFLSASMVMTTPAISFAQEFTNGTVTVKGDEVEGNVVEAKDANVTVNGSLSHNTDGDSIIAENSNVTVNGNVDGNITTTINYNEDETETGKSSKVIVNGNATNTSVFNEDSSSITINGDISLNSDSEKMTDTVISSLDGGEIYVGGNITANTKKGGVGIAAIDNKSITVGGNISITGTDSTYHFDDEKDRNEYAVSSNGVIVSNEKDETTSEVAIGGTIAAVSKGFATGLSVSAGTSSKRHDQNKEAAKIYVTIGSITAKGGDTVEELGDTWTNTSTGIDASAINDAEVNIVVKGDVTADTGIRFGQGKPSADLKKGTTNILIDGTLNASDNAVVIKNRIDSDTANITVWKINTDNENLVQAKKYPTDENGRLLDDPETAKKQEEAINYIIRHEGTITLDGAQTVTTFTGESYDVAQANKQLTIHVKVDDEKKYRVDRVEGGTATATKNKDGSWTLTVPKNGGVDIRAVLVAIEQNENHGSSGSSSGSAGSSSSSSGGSGSSSSGGSSSGGGSSSSRPGVSIPSSGAVVTTTEGTTVQTNVTKSDTSSVTDATIKIGTSTVKVSKAVSNLNGTKVTFQNSTGNLMGASFEGVGQISSDGVTLVKEDGTTAKMATGMLLAIENADGTSVGCFVDATGKTIATGAFEVYYMLGTDGKLHAHFVNPQGYFMTGIQVINGMTVTFNTVGEMVSVI